MHLRERCRDGEATARLGTGTRVRGVVGAGSGRRCSGVERMQILRHRLHVRPILFIILKLTYSIPIQLRMLPRRSHLRSILVGPLPQLLKVGELRPAGVVILIVLILALHPLLLLNPASIYPIEVLQQELLVGVGSLV